MDDPRQIKGYLWLTSGLIFLEMEADNEFAIVYRYNLSLSKNENMFEINK